MATQTQQVSHARSHGVKRPHDDDLDNAQRLAKRFHLLNIGAIVHTCTAEPRLTYFVDNQQNGKLWVPPQAEHAAQTPKLVQSGSAYMELDDTKDRIYIHDLDAELANVSDTDDEERVIFLPDIEKRLNQIPRRALVEGRSEEPSGQEVILYNVPHSLTLPAEQDNVRKAIIEARARARNQQRKGDVVAGAAMAHNSNLTENSPGLHQSDKQTQVEDVDAMDIG